MNVAHSHFGWPVRCRVALNILSLHLSPFLFLHFMIIGNFLLTHALRVLTVAPLLALFHGLGLGRRCMVAGAPGAYLLEF